MRQNTMIGDVLGLFIPPVRAPSNAPWADVAAIGPNLELRARQGVRFAFATPRPGVHVIVEYPDADAVAPYVQTLEEGMPGVRGEGAGFWVNLAEGIGKAANTITFGLVDGILRYDPKAQGKIAEGERLRAQAQIDAQKAALIAEAEAQAEIAVIMAKAQSRVARINDSDDDPPAGTRMPVGVPVLMLPKVAGACCSSCARGGPCEGSCHGH